MKPKLNQLFNRKNLRLPFVYDVSHSLITKGLTIAVGTVATILVTRTLGPELKGVYSIVITWVGVLLQLSLFGLHSSNAYYLAKDRSLLKTLLANSIAFILGIWVLIAAFLLLSRNVFKIPLGLPEHNLLFIILIGYVLSISNIVLQNLCLAIKKVSLNNYVLIGAKLASFFFLLWFYFNDSLTVQNALIVYLIELFATVGVLLPFISLQDLSGWKLSLEQFKRSLRFGFKVYLASILSFLVIRSDIFLIKWFLDYEQVGYYGTAVQIVDQVSIVAATIGGILMPRLTMIDEIGEKKFRTKQVVKGILFIMALIILPIMLFADDIILLLFKEEFLPSVASLRILLVATAFLSLIAILVQFLVSEGFPFKVVTFWALGFLINLSLNVFMIPRYGIEGAAISSLISYLFVLICVVVYIRNKYTVRKT